MDRKDSFLDWLIQSAGKKESTANGYVSALKNAPKWFSVNLDKPILEMTDLAEFTAAMAIIQALPTYSTVNMNHQQGNFSVAAALYEDYLLIQDGREPKNRIDTEIDYISLLNYIKTNRGIPYQKVDKEGLSDTEREQFASVKKKGQAAVSELMKIVKLCGLRYGLTKCKTPSWTDGSNSKTGQYLWAQTKYQEYKDSPYSVSVSVDVDDTDQECPEFVISLGMKDDNSDDSVRNNYHRHLDLPLNKEAGLFYHTGTRKFNAVVGKLEDDRDEIRKRIADGVLMVVAPRREIKYDPNQTNDYYESEILKTVQSIIPYYEYILDIGAHDHTEKVEEIEMEREFDNSSMYDKNMILYGPPGTGKTYNTAIYAVAMCERKSIDSVREEEYSDVMARFNKLKSEGRIAFTTFHQSYGYEEFIEGIKPVIEDDESKMGYTIEPGVFKSFCETASAPLNSEIDHNATIWFVRLNNGGENDLKTECFRDNVIRFNWAKKDYDSDYMKWFLAMHPGDFVVSYHGRSTDIDAIGKIEDSEPFYDDNKTSFNWTRKVTWLAVGIKENIKELNGNTYLPNFEIAKLRRMKISDLMSIVSGQKEKAAQTNHTPYVFIIDEINRGNISKIFGELITLIEDTKRTGMSEQASAILPYSQEVFSVPNNVYILGTMNTADRSIALMDTALRRRFCFVEMLPDSNILRNIGADRVEDLDIATMLDTINERITYLYDREHTIGHAFFTGLAKNPTVEALKEIFEKSVIPLLQEYFYEDYSKIQLVLGDNGKTDQTTKFILDEKLDSKRIFKGHTDEIGDLPEKRYTINKSAFSNIESYKQIM